MSEKRKSFTDQKTRVATIEDIKGSWGGSKNGKRFRCYLCGYKFTPGDRWRWVYGASTHLMNFLVCWNCDCEDVLDRWVQANKELDKRFWWALDE